MLLSNSGGLIYHMRYRLHRNLWSSHKSGVAHFLKSLNWKGVQTLVLVGPSGGYSLPADFLKSFSEVQVFEPDWFARLVLRIRFPNVSFVFLGGEFSAQTWSSLDSDDRRAVLFCNLLGQITLNLQDLPDWDQKCSQIKMASFHDRYSVQFPREFELGRTRIQELPRLSDAQSFLDFVGRNWDAAWGKAVINEHHVPLAGKSLHLAGGWLWNLSPSRFHWIEGVYTPRLGC